MDQPPIQPAAHHSTGDSAYQIAVIVVVLLFLATITLF
jgi:hypothetical protein